MAVDPVRSRQPSPSLDAAARFALRLHLRAAPRCLESVSTTDVRVTSTRGSSTFGDLFDCRGKPAGARIEDLANEAFPPSVREDAGPPCGHPASNGRAFDGARPALDRSATAPALSRSRGGSCLRFIGWGTALPRRASDTLIHPLTSPLCASNLPSVPSKYLRIPLGTFLASERSREHSTGRDASGDGS